MSGHTFSLKQRLGTPLASDDVLDTLQQVQTENWDSFKIQDRSQDTAQIRITAKNASHGVVGDLTLGPSTELRFEGRIVITDWFWPCCHLILTIVFLPYAAIGIWRMWASQKKAQSLPMTLIEKLQSGDRICGNG